ncbi:putative bifunctional diguanylate cyclase/phosphodiesterase [Stappia stellulata]|uniref:putative bifunctional diguanylate cyclase/phosphodiesterase n=1 Tax=Stappia stellulata TaxID=71235 RepID=UPI0003FAF914|nr:bifunctional diguanylate cyclase/phosphodiesterase [Stappia stellulata]
MSYVLSCIATEHNPFLVALAALMCVVGSWISFSLFRRARDTRGSTRAGWLFLNGMASGSAVWCTHFIAILAFETPLSLEFDPLLTILSLMLAIVGTGIGFGLASSGWGRFAPEAGGLFVGAAIAGMHYLGMAALHVEGFVEWNVSMIVASVALVAGFGVLSLNRAMRPVTRWCHHGAAFCFFLAVVTLHFTGVAALTITPLAPVNPGHQPALWALAFAVAGVGTLVIGMGVVTALIDLRTRALADADRMRLSTSDPLTGLGNRAAFNRVLEDGCSWADASNSQLCVVLVDFDDFKSINQLRGYSAGDAFLTAIGARVMAGLQPEECAMRLGGDEFVVVKRLTDGGSLQGFLDRLQALFTDPVRASGTALSCPVCMGVAIYPDHGLSSSDLLANVGLALARAKQDKLSPVQFSDTVMDAAEKTRRTLGVLLRGVVERGELVVQYQPQFDLETGAISGAEALLRWTHPVLGPVSPADFIPVAEASGQIVGIGEWVLREACRHAAAWPSPFKVAVNLSAVQLRQANLPERVAAILKETGLPASRLELEVTETSLMADLERSVAVLRRLRETGVSIALDDFGTGYSALASLQVFSFDRLKLDKSFAGDLAMSKEARAILKTVLLLGQSLAIPVLAEGVETEPQAAFLREAGCPNVQGFLYSRPISDGALRAMILAQDEAGPRAAARHA